MTCFYNAWLDEQDYRIRIKQIPWEGYQRASVISSDDMSLLQVVSGQPKAKREQVWKESTKDYITLYLKLLAELSRVDCLQNILVSLNDIFNEDEQRIRLVLQIASSDSLDLSSSLGRHLNSSDDYLRLKSLALLSILLGSSHPQPEQDVLRHALEAANKLISSDDSSENELAIECLQHILRQPSARKVVWTATDKSSTPESGLLASLTRMLEAGSKLNAQMQYRTAFCFWLLTFDPEIASQINKKYAVIPLLIELVRNAVKEKVTRVLVATLRNLIEISPENNVGVMLVAGNLLPLVQSLSVRKWSDEELKDDIMWLKEQLEEARQKMTTYDEYSTELESGSLRWSPAHSSEEFWAQNAEKLNSKDFQQLKTLIRLLSEATDPVVLAVAANDVSKYVKYCETGKKSVERLGAKNTVMNLMSHPNPDVKYWALVTVQQLISHSWAL